MTDNPAQRRCSQATWVKLTSARRRNNSFGEEFAHHFGLAGIVQLVAGSLKGFTHRRSCLWFKRVMFDGGIDWHAATPAEPGARVGDAQGEAVK